MSCPKCGSNEKHFCPPSLGEPGFYLCECPAPASPALAEAAREVLAYRETAKESSRVHIEMHNQIVDLQAEVARLRKEKRIAENETADADRAIDALKRIIGHDRTRIAELEAGLRDALHDCSMSMEPELHASLAALLGEDAK